MYTDAQLDVAVEYDETKPESLCTPIGPNQTKFYPSDADGPSSETIEAYRKNRHSYSRELEFKLLRTMNSGDSLRDVYRKERVLSGRLISTIPSKDIQQSNDRKERFITIAGNLELTEEQKRLGCKVRQASGLRNLGYPDELVCFCLCVFLCRTSPSIKGRPDDLKRVYHPDRSSENNDTLFMEVAKDLGFKKKLIRACLGKMVRDLPEWSGLGWS